MDLNIARTQAIDFIKKSLSELFADKIPIDKFTMSNRLTGFYKLKGKSIFWTNGLCINHMYEKEIGTICKTCTACNNQKKECQNCKLNFEQLKKAHVRIAQRLRKIDPISHPRPPDRVPFVYIVNKNARALQCDRTEHPDYLNNSKIDTLYYFEHQIKEPVLQLFTFVVKDPPAIFAEIVEDKMNKMNKQKSIKEFFKSS